MNLLQKIFSRKSSAAPAGTVIPTAGPGRFEVIGGTITFVSDNLRSYVVNGYQANDIIYSCVNLIMEKIKVAPWGIYKVVDEGALKLYHAFIEKKDYTEAVRMRKKALQPVTNYDLKTGKINDLLKWPNEYNTGAELISEVAGYELVTGNNFLWANLLQAGANTGLPQELWNAPAQYMGIIATRGWPERAVGYQLQNGYYQKFRKEEIMHTKLWNPEYSANGQQLYGQSPIKAGINVLTRNRAAKKAGAVQLDNNGVSAIAYIDDPIAPATGRQQQIDGIKSTWNKEYTGADNFGKVAFSGYKMGVANVGLSLKDMGLTDVEKVDLRSIANLMGIPSQLLNDPDNKIYANTVEGEKALTTRCALPKLIQFRDNFNRKLQSDWGLKGVNIYVDFDMSVYTELQEDQGKKWEWVSKLPASSKYKMDMMGLEAEEAEGMDQIILPSGFMTLQDIINSVNDANMNATNDLLNSAGLKDYLRVAK